WELEIVMKKSLEDLQNEKKKGGGSREEVQRLSPSAGEKEFEKELEIAISQSLEDCLQKNSEDEDEGNGHTLDILEAAAILQDISSGKWEEEKIEETEVPTVNSIKYYYRGQKETNFVNSSSNKNIPNRNLRLQ